MTKKTHRKKNEMEPRRKSAGSLIFDACDFSTFCLTGQNCNHVNF